MPIYVMLTRVSPEMLSEPSGYVELERDIMERIRSECPGVQWLHNLAVLGPYDYLDVFRAPDNETAMKVSAVVRTRGHAHVEVWAAEEWQRFKELMAETSA
jgi:uncharacterized protein with GYD domain